VTRRWGNQQGASQRGLELDLGNGEKKGSPERSPHNDTVRAEEGGDGSGIRWSMAVARVLESDGASAETSWWFRLDWRRAEAASLPQLDRAQACSHGGPQLTLLAEEKVVGAARWPDSEAMWRWPSNGDPGVEERRGSASGRAGPDGGVGPILDCGHAAGSRTRGGQV
jgi:hypothetical protein